MKVFLDTNVLVSAVATRGLCADVLRKVFQSHQLVICVELLQELERTLRDRLGVPDERLYNLTSLIAGYLRLLRQDATEAIPLLNFELGIHDQEDVKLISAAINAGSDVFITGDQELLELARIENMEILSPRGFWEKRFSNLTRLKSIG